MCKKSKIRCGGLIYLVFFVLAIVTTSAHADKLSGLADVTVVDDAIVSFRYEGTEYVVADEDLVLGTTTRWYIDAGVEVLWPEGDPVPAAAPTVAGTSTPKANDVGSKADNFLFRLNGSNNISSIDGIDFQETIFPFLASTFFHFERGGNDTGTWQAILADGSLGAPVAFSGASDYANTGVSVGDQNAYGVVFTTDVPVQGVRITASGHDTLSISTPVPLPVLASIPSPPDGSTDVPRDVVINWTQGIYAAPTNGHKVYFGESFNNVNDAVGAVAQDANSYTPAQRLDFNKTYYWRVDEVNAPPTSHIEFKGEVWSFTTEPVAYAIEDVTATASSAFLVDTGPENTVNGSGMDADDLHSTEQTDMWLSGSDPNGAWIEFEFDEVYKLYQMLVWNSNQAIESFIGYGCKGVTIEYSADGTNYATLGTTGEFAQAPGTPDYAHNTTIDFGGVAAKNVRITVNSNWGSLNQYSLSEVRFLYVPVLPREPQPESGATGVDVDATLSFRAGREAATHNVYISTDLRAVMDNTADVTTLTEASHGPLLLDLGQFYYWKVNEVNEVETPTMWEGDIWNFRTQDYFVVEDFEDYNDYPGHRIYETWSDGWQILTNGATIGYPEPLPVGGHILETTDFHSGEQSLPFFYDNSVAASSEASVNIAELQIGSDWTKSGVKSLSLWFSGDPSNSAEQMYVKLNGVKVPYDGDAGNLLRTAWQPFNINLADFAGVDLSNVTELSIGFERGAGGSGMMLFDDARLYPPPPPLDEVWFEAESADILGASWRIYDDPGSSGGRHIGTDHDSAGDDNDAAPGVEWVAVYNFDAAGGTYKVLLRAQEAGHDSFWVRIPTAAGQTHEDPDQPGTGWVRFNGIDAPDGWAWDEVHSDDHNQEVVNWTLPAGAHTLEIAKREDGMLLDGFVITNQLDLDQATLPDVIPQVAAP